MRMMISPEPRGPRHGQGAPRGKIDPRHGADPWPPVTASASNLGQTSAKMDEPSSSAESTLVMDDKCVNEARSTTPIPPALPPRPDKRALLLIYIHGFKGNETSFIEFPTVWSQK